MIDIVSADEYKRLPEDAVVMNHGWGMLLYVDSLMALFSAWHPCRSAWLDAPPPEVAFFTNYVLFYPPTTYPTSTHGSESNHRWRSNL